MRQSKIQNLKSKINTGSKMKLMSCPVNGARPVNEFVYGGEYEVMPDPQNTDDADWASYIYHRNNAPTLKKEWWCHSPSNTWFIAERNTLTDEVVQTYLFGEKE